jgi:hypothetical protein
MSDISNISVYDKKNDMLDIFEICKKLIGGVEIKDE